MQKNEPEGSEKAESYTGQIVLGDQWIRFDCRTDCWSIAEYQQQWRAAIERLTTHDSSCFVRDVAPHTRGICFWAAYKWDSVVEVHSVEWDVEACRTRIGDRQYTPETCYDYVPSYEEAQLERGKYYASLPLDIVLRGQTPAWNGLPLFSIRLLAPQKPASYMKSVPIYTGEIAIGDHSEYLWVYGAWWSPEQYQQQWREAIERLRYHDTSCFMVIVSGKNKIDGIEMWALYKQGELVRIRDLHICGKNYRKIVGKRPWTPQTCYQYIEPYKPMRCSEWTIPLQSILQSIEE